MQTTGSFADGQLRATTSVVPGSGRGALAGLRGEGTISAALGQTGAWTLDYDFD